VDSHTGNSHTENSQKGDAVELLVGRVGRTHGVRGDVVIDVRTDEPQRRFAPGTAFSTSRGQLTVASSRWHGQRLLVGFTGVTGRTAAEELRGAELRITVAADLRPDDPEEFYDHHLVGLRAESEAGRPIGEVSDVLHLPAQDVLVVRHNDRDVLVPFVADIVPTVDLDAGRLVIVDQPGLLDDSTPDTVQTPADDTGGA
jgi:16S rRNA processing protein RimM